MNEFVPFKLTLTLATPFIMDTPVTLDALLSAAIQNATGLTEVADIEAHMPLARSSGVWKASSLFADKKTYKTAIVNRVMGLRNEGDLSVDLFSPNTGKGENKRYGFVDRQRGDYKTNLDTYYAKQAQQVFFWGVGDPAKVEKLINHYIVGIGKRTSSGAGEITLVDCHECEFDLSWMTLEGKPARPIPVAVWESIGGGVAPTKYIAVSFPYWETPKVEAVSSSTWVV